MDPPQNSSSLPPLPDAFALHDNGDLPTPSFSKSAGSPPASASKQRLPRFTPTRTFGGIGLVHTPHPPFTTLSPSPSTPAQNPFNPDDFFASPPHPATQDTIQGTERYTPDLKRRLFVPTDPLQSIATNSARKLPSTPISLGLHTPLPQPNFNNPLSSGPADETNSLDITPAFSSDTHLLPAIPPTSQQAQTLPSATINLGKRPASHPPPLPGTPFTPATTAKKKCSCKSSKCLKLYCPCFANSGFCGSDCTCKNCLNTHMSVKIRDAARDTVLSRDPRAFEPKVRNSPATALGGDIHTKGCNCRKGCAKNYCVCRELRVDCGPRCTCSGPNGCLNGKVDALEDHQFKCKADHILGAAKQSGPAKWRPGMLPLRTPRLAKTVSPLKQEIKRLKKEVLDEVPKRLPQQSPGSDIANFMSPSFPAFGMAFSPNTDMRNSMDELAKVMGTSNDSETPFSLRGVGKMPMIQDVNESSGLDVKSQSHSDLQQTQDTLMTHICLTQSQLKDKNPSHQQADNEDKTARVLFSTRLTEPTTSEHISSAAFAQQEYKPEAKNGAATDSPEEAAGCSGGSHLESGPSAPAVTAKMDSANQSTPPEQCGKVPNLESASSPTTDGKDANVRTWTAFRTPLFGKEENFEVCRVPRILRVKMGSGRMLRKFDI